MFYLPAVGTFTRLENSWGPSLLGEPPTIICERPFYVPIHQHTSSQLSLRNTYARTSNSRNSHTYHHSRACIVVDCCNKFGWKFARSIVWKNNIPTCQQHIPRSCCHFLPATKLLMGRQGLRSVVSEICLYVWAFFFSSWRTSRGEHVFMPCCLE